MMPANPVVVLLVLLFLGGCATNPPFHDAERREVRSVTVSPEIVMPALPQVFGPEASRGFFLLGPIGTMAAAQGNADSVAFGDFLQKHKIDVRGIVRGEFIRSLAAGRVSVVETGGEARFQLKIEQYGLGPGFSLRPIDAPLRPTLRIAATLHAADGRILWQNADFVTGMSDLPSRRFDEYLADPGATREALRVAAQRTIDGLLKDLDGHQSIVLLAPARQPMAAPALPPMTAPALPPTVASTLPPTAAPAVPPAAGPPPSSQPPAAPGGAAVAATSSGGAVPMVGATWRYQVQDRLYRGEHSFEVRFVGASGGIFSEVFATDGAPVSSAALDTQSLRFFDRPMGSGRRLVEFAPYLLSAMRGEGLESFPAAGGYPIGGSAEPFKIRIVRAIRERLMVPAGSFDNALRLEVSGERSPRGFAGLGGQWDTAGVARFHYTVWYAEEVQRYVMATHRQWNPSNVEITNEVVQLLAHSPR